MAELYHHGILGQKWGKKNGPPYPLSESKHQKVIKRYKTSSELSDDDLKRAINRMENENKYNKLVAERTKKPDGLTKKFINKFADKAVESASQMAVDYISGRLKEAYGMDTGGSGKRRRKK